MTRVCYSPYDASQDLFDDDYTRSALLPSDALRLRDFRPAAGGSLGEHVGYASDVSDEEIEEESADSCQSTSPGYH